MATYVTYTPSSLIAKAMFNFDVSGESNFKYSGTIAVSVSDSFGYYDWYYGVVNNIDYTMYPLSPEFSWTQSDLSNIQGALSILSNFANLNFSSVTDYDTNGIYTICTPAAVGLAGVSDINIAFNYNRDSRVLGISGGCLDSAFGYSGARGDILINYNGSSFTDGKDFAEFTKSRQVLLHEIGHSLGLSHPHYPQNVLTSDYAALVTVGFQNLGFVINSPSDLNKEYFSIMSYDDQSDISLNNAYTPMILDVIALQEAYGEGQGTSGSGNDVIQAGYTGYRTYFDKGGIDTIDASLYSAGCYLNMGVSISGAPHKVGLLVSKADALNLFVGTGSPQSLRWLYGEYENAIGSSSVDLIEGNNLDNVIDAGEGDDFIYGEDGNDTICGGIGNDTIDCGGGSSDCVSYSYARQDYTITYLSGTYTVTAKSGSEGIDSIKGVESFQFSDQLVAATSVIDTTPPPLPSVAPRLRSRQVKLPPSHLP